MKQDPRQFRSKILQTVFIGLLSLALFWNLSGNQFTQEMGLAGFLFFACIQNIMAHFTANLLVF